MTYESHLAKAASRYLIVTAISSSIALASEQEGWRQWGGRLPHTIGCVNGTLTWRQTTSARMVHPSEQWSDFQTTAEVDLTLTRPDHSAIKEKGVARNTGVMSSLTGSRISAGVGTQSISLKLDSKILCESWKLDKPTPGFFSDWNK